MFKKFLKTKNPYYSKIKNTIKSIKEIKKIKYAYFIGGFEYLTENYNNVKQSIREDKLEKELKKYTFNNMKDNVEIYYFENIYNKKYVVCILDPFDYLQKEVVLDIIKVKKINYNNFSASEQIFP